MNARLQLCQKEPSRQPKQRIRSAVSVLRALQPHPSALYRVRSVSALSQSMIGA
jgi:hypothetical protein